MKTFCITFRRLKTVIRGGTTILAMVAMMLVSTALRAQTVGSSAPDFTLKTTANVTYNLSDFKGKVVMVVVFGYSCPYCIAAAPELKAKILQPLRSNSNLVVLGVEAWNGTSAQVNAFDSQTSLGIPLLTQGGSVATQYGSTYDRLWVIDSKGVLVHKGSTNISGDITSAKRAVDNALSEVALSVGFIQADVVKVMPSSNPMIGSGSMVFNLPTPSKVTLSLYDLTGKLTATLAQGQYAKGNFVVPVMREDIPAGLYIYRFESNTGIISGRLVIK